MWICSSGEKQKQCMKVKEDGGSCPFKGKQKKHIAPQAAYRTLENCRFTTIVLPKLDGLRD